MDLIIIALLPEIFLSFCILIHLLFNIFLLQNKRINFPLLNKEYLFQCFFILICVIILILKNNFEGSTLMSLLIINKNISALKLFIVLIAILFLLPSWRHYIFEKLNFYEFFNLYLILILIFLLLISANDLIIIYILLEMQSLIFYIFSNFKRSSAFSSEAGLKYFISGSVFSGIFLFGCFLLYSIFGSLNFTTLELLLSIPLNNVSIYSVTIIAVVLVSSTFMFKLTLVPFHFWSPDVYEGAPLSATLILSTIPKFVIFTLLMRWVSSIFYIFNEISYLFIIIGLFSIFIGIFFANRQKRIKRFIAYSSISQLGYIIIFFNMITIDNYAGIYFFLIIYLITSIIIWIFLVLFDIYQAKNNTFLNKERVSVFISTLSNMIVYNKGWSLILLIIFASLAGLPPLSGFLPKMFLFFSLTTSSNGLVNILLVISTCLVIWYYINIITLLFMEIQTKVKKYFISSFTYIYCSLFCDYMDYLIVVTCSLLLLFIFFKPSFIYLICQYFALFI